MPETLEQTFPAALLRLQNEHIIIHRADLGLWRVEVFNIDGIKPNDDVFLKLDDSVRISASVDLPDGSTHESWLEITTGNSKQSPTYESASMKTKIRQFLKLGVS